MGACCSNGSDSKSNTSTDEQIAAQIHKSQPPKKDADGNPAPVENKTDDSSAKTDSNNPIHNDSFWKCILYENDDFTGEKVGLNGSSSFDHRKTSFKSIVINSGFWVCYEKPNFGGNNLHMLHGRHKLPMVIESTLLNGIKSARFIDIHDDHVRHIIKSKDINPKTAREESSEYAKPLKEAPPMIIVYSEFNNGGYHRLITNDTGETLVENLDRLKYTDTTTYLYQSSNGNHDDTNIASYYVIKGTWVFYLEEDAGYSRINQSTSDLSPSFGGACNMHSGSGPTPWIQFQAGAARSIKNKL